MKSLFLKSRNGYGRSLCVESLETRRLLTVVLLPGAAHAANVVHQELSDAAEVGKAIPGGDAHANGSGKYVDLSSADHVSSTSPGKVYTALSATKQLPVPAVSKASSKTLARSDDSAGSSDSSITGEKSDAKSKTDNTSDNNVAGASVASTANDHGQTDKKDSGTNQK